MWLVIADDGTTKHINTTKDMVAWLKQNPGSRVWWKKN